MALTAKRVALLRKKPGRYLDGGDLGHGLYLQVLSPSNASWILRYQQNGRKRWMGLGPLHTIGLAEARERARKARAAITRRHRPARRQGRGAGRSGVGRGQDHDLRASGTAYFDAHEHSWRNAKHRAQFLSSLNAYVFPKIGKLPVATIDTGQVLQLHRADLARQDRNRQPGARPHRVGTGLGEGPQLSVPATIRRGGGVISTRCCRRASASPGSNTSRRCRTPRSPPSWRRSANATASPPARLNS